MNFERCFKVWSNCFIGSGFFAIACTGSIRILPLVLFACAFVISWFIDTAKFNLWLPSWVINAIALGYLPFFFIDYKFLTHSLLICTIHLIFIMAAIKVLTLSKERDYIYLYLISFAELIAASTLTIGMVYALSLLVFLVSGIVTLALFEIRKSHRRTQTQDFVRPVVVTNRQRNSGLELLYKFPTRTMLGMSIAITLAVLGLAAPIFIILPRVHSGEYSHPSTRNQLLTGFSEKVELGAIGKIKKSNITVMRVKLDLPAGNAPATLKWRGVALEYFDGQSWSRPNQIRLSVPLEGNYFKLEKSVSSSNMSNLLWQDFFIEALSSDVVFASQKVLAISQDLQILQQDASGTLYAPVPSAKRRRYTAISAPTIPDPALMARWPSIYPEEIRKCCLQIPQSNQKISALAKNIVSSVQDNYGKAKKIEEYLKSHYQYSLDLKASDSSQSDPLSAFLFETRKGHCEYFASAMTLLLRHLGIPARLINGFQIGEYNKISNAWIVRQYNAHSWVEAWLAPYGWVEFDPTPPEPAQDRSFFLSAISNLTDALDLWWWEGVVHYNLTDQYRIAINARTATMQFMKEAKDSAQRLFKNSRVRSKDLFVAGPFRSIAILILCCACGSFLFLKLGLFKRFRKFWFSHKSDPTRLAQTFYGEALELLARHGHPRRKGQTPGELAASLTGHPAALPFAALTELYHRTRFGHETDPNLRAKTNKLLLSLKSSLKNQTLSSHG